MTYNKVAVVTSTATALGLAVTRNLVEQGYFVFGFLDRRDLESNNADKLIAIDGIKVLNGNITHRTDWSGLARSIEEVCKELGMRPQVDLFINIPILGAEVSADRIGEFELDMELREGLFGAFNGIQTLKSLLSQSHNSNIINIYPIADVRPVANLTTAITSAALDMLTKCLASSYDRVGISVNSICPDSLSNGYYDLNTENATSQLIDTTLNTINYLVNGDGRRNNGQILFIQGNYSVATSLHSVLENVYV